MNGSASVRSATIHVHEGGHEIEPGEDTAKLHSVQFLDQLAERLGLPDLAPRHG